MGPGKRRGFDVKLKPDTRANNITSAEITDERLTLSDPLSTGDSSEGALA